MQGVRVERISDTEEKVGSKIDIHFIGFDPNTRLGGPIEVIEGRDTPGPGEVIIDERLSQRYGIAIGDTLRAGGRDWAVIGKSRGGGFIATQTVFVTHAEAQAALRMQGATTFYVIKVCQGVDPAQVGAALEDQAARNEAPVITHTRQEFAKATRDRVTSNVLMRSADLSGRIWHPRDCGRRLFNSTVGPLGSGRRRDLYVYVVCG